MSAHPDERIRSVVLASIEGLSAEIASHGSGGRTHELDTLAAKWRAWEPGTPTPYALTEPPAVEAAVPPPLPVSTQDGRRALRPWEVEQERRRAVRPVLNVTTCPRCGALPGKQCIEGRGGRLEPHEARFAAARARGVVVH